MAKTEEKSEELEEELEEMREEDSEEAPTEPEGQNGSFQIKKENSRILKGIVETLASVIDETEFLVTPDEFIITAMDQSRICLLKLSIKKDDFDEYECTGEARVGLNLDDLDKIFKRSSTNDAIELQFNEKDQKIKIKMQKDDSTKVRTFSLSLLDIDIEEVPMDGLLKIEYPSKWTIEPDIMVEAIKDAEIYSEVLNLKAEQGKGLKFSSSGQIGEMVYDLEESDLMESTLKDTQIGSYSLTFLKAILKIASITQELKMSLRSDHPLKMNFTILEGGELNYFLAPRVSEEMDDPSDDMDEF